MTIALPETMREALRLTQSGDLAGATALLRGGRAPSPAHTRQPIDLTPARARIAPLRLPSNSVPPPRTAPQHPPLARGSFTDRRFKGPGGTMDYALYVPAAAAPGMPLVVMLHGCTQDPHDFARGTGMNALADELGFVVAYPRQPQRAHPQKCWNWYRPGDQARGGGEPALIAGLTREIVAAQRADSARVYVAGLSAGGAAAAIMAAAYPDLYAAVGIHSGLGCGAAHDLPSALAAMQGRGSRQPKQPSRSFVPAIVFHGDRDTTVSDCQRARAIVAAAAASFDGSLRTEILSGTGIGGTRHTRAISRDTMGRAMIEHWTLHGAGHAWSGGDARGSYTDPAGPEASRAMLEFFLTHRNGAGPATD